MPPIDRAALLRGGAVAVAVCLPLAVLAEVVSDADSVSGWASLLNLGVLAGFVVAGVVASRRASTSPLLTGGLAASVGFLVIQGVALVIRIARGDSLPLSSAVLNAVVAYGCGLTGAALAERRRVRS